MVKPTKSWKQCELSGWWFNMLRGTNHIEMVKKQNFTSLVTLVVWIKWTMPKGERFVSSATICFPSLGAVGWRHRSVSIGPGRPLVKCLLSIDEVLPVFRWNCMNPPKPPFDLRFYHVVSHIFFEFFWLHVRGWWSDCLFKWFIRVHPIYDDPFNVRTCFRALQPHGNRWPAS